MKVNLLKNSSNAACVYYSDGEYIAEMVNYSGGVKLIFSI